jgi:hypothetical protein
MEFLVSREKREATVKAPIPFILPNMVMNTIGITNKRYAFEMITKAKHFSARVLAFAVQQGISHIAIKKYMESFKAEQVRSYINEPIFCPTLDIGIPVLFFAVESGSEEHIRTLVQAGADLQAQTTDWKVGVLAYTVLRAIVDLRHTTDTFRVLIGLGADPMQIPEGLWKSYMKPDPGSVTRPVTCREIGEASLQNSISKSINLTQRYLLYTAHANGSPQLPTANRRELGELYQFGGILEAPYAIIGQAVATKELVQRVSRYFISKQDEKSPLVMAFTGASGHGKTELAFKVRGMLGNPPFYQVNCGEVTHASDIFGPKPPFKGCDKSVRLNEFLVKNQGERCIVFMDEFEKMPNGVRDALLCILDGKYTCQVTGMPIKECLKVIWIFATNLSESTITDFAQKHEKLGDNFLKLAPFDELHDSIRAEFENKMGSPITGRIRFILPYFRFTENEQAVVVHAYYLSAVRNCRKPFCKRKPHDNILGDLHIEPFDESQMCHLVAKRKYVPTQGARSLDNGVTELLIGPIVDIIADSREPLERHPRANTSLKRLSILIEKPEASVAKRQKLVVTEEKGRVPIISASLPKRDLEVLPDKAWEFINDAVGDTVITVTTCIKCKTANHTTDECSLMEVETVE